MNNESARRDLLSTSRTRLHVTHDLDTTGRLAAENACVGIGKIVYALRHLGMRGDVRFVASLDFTITRHAERWGSGFSYGGALEIMIEGDAIAIPEVRPNTCGTIVGVPRDEISASELMRRVCDARHTRKGTFDYSRKNHFVNVYRSSATGKPVFIIHGCPARVKFDGHEGPGLYLETSSYWDARAMLIMTPLGPLRPLVGDNAVAYWENYRRCEERSKADRLAVAKTIFDRYDLIADHTHEGMLAQHIYLHGCHAARTPEAVFPVMSSMGEPAFLVSRNARSPTVGDNNAVLPHGTGYSIQVPARDFEMRYISDHDRVFFGHGAEHDEAYSSFEDVPFTYRPNDIVSEWESQELLTIRDVLRPDLFMKL